MIIEFKYDTKISSESIKKTACRMFLLSGSARWKQDFTSESVKLTQIVSSPWLQYCIVYLGASGRDGSRQGVLKSEQNFEFFEHDHFWWLNLFCKY